MANDLNHFILQKASKLDLSKHIIDRGYPEILKIDNQKAKYLWFSSYIRTYIESDARDLANIRNIDKFSKMYRLCMLRSGNIFNKNELQKECGLDNKIFDSYFAVLEHTFQIQKLKQFFKNELKRVIKSPKIYATDTGILSHLLQINSKDRFEKQCQKMTSNNYIIYKQNYQISLIKE